MNKKIYMPILALSVLLSGCAKNETNQPGQSNEVEKQTNQNNNNPTKIGNNQQNNNTEQQPNTGNNNTKTVTINEKYQDPYGEDEKLKGSIELSDGIIKKVEINDKEAFNDYADENLVGKELGELEKVDIVSNASRTARAFNKFLQEYSN